MNELRSSRTFEWVRNLHFYESVFCYPRYQNIVEKKDETETKETIELAFLSFIQRCEETSPVGVSQLSS